MEIIGIMWHGLQKTGLSLVWFRVNEALKTSRIGSAINTFFVERCNRTDQHQNSRKIRKTSWFSKDWYVDDALTSLMCGGYNFCWPVRTLRIKQPNGIYQQTAADDVCKMNRRCLDDQRMAQNA